MKDGAPFFVHGDCPREQTGAGRVYNDTMGGNGITTQRRGDAEAAESADDLLRRIRELEKENARLAHELTRKVTGYGLQWIDCPEAFDTESENRIPVLKEVAEKEIKNADGKPTHILIEGDNYHALTCLNFTHRGKIDVIYIDPPYNTGEDFTYCDKRFLDKYPNGELIGKDHALRHSTWLSFMCKRLKLAKSLLRDNGAIFISINEDEYANLRLLCDKIFDERNYIATFTVRVRHEDRILKGDKPIHETTEFLLMYQRSHSFKIQKREVDNSDPSEYRYRVKELIDSPEVIEMGGKNVCVFRPGQYEIEEVSPSFKNLKKINIRGSIKRGNSSGRFHMTHLEPLKDAFNVLYKVEGIGDDGLGYRYFLSRSSANRANGFYFQGEPLERADIREIPYPNNMDMEEAFNAVGTEGGVPFDGGKKPIDFIKMMMVIAGVEKNKNATILDFFAGSGSTLHAICDMNGDDGLRSAIIVQSADATFEIKNGIERSKKGCENAYNGGFKRIVDITRKRAENVIQGYCDTTGRNVTGFGGSLKYYRTAFVGKHGCTEALDEDRDELAENAGTMLALAEGTLEAVAAPDGAAKLWRHYTDGAHRHTLVYQSSDYAGYPSLSEEADRIRCADAEARLVVYAYTIGGDVAQFENEFDGGLDRLELKPIPEPILQIYRSLNGE